MEHPDVDPPKPIGQRSIELTLLLREVAKMEIGDVLTKARAAEITGLPPKSPTLGERMRRVMKIIMLTERMHVQTVRDIGWERVTDSVAAGSVVGDLRTIRRKGKRTLTKVQHIDLFALSAGERGDLVGRAALVSVATEAASAKAQRRLCGATRGAKELVAPRVSARMAFEALTS